MRFIEPIVLVGRLGKGCRQYSFRSLDDLQAWVKRKPYCSEQLLVMPMHGRRFLGKEWMPASATVEYVRELVSQAREDEEAAARLAKTLLEQVERESGQCAYWFISALSKLISTQPHLRAADALQFMQAAMPQAALEYAQYVEDKS